MYDHCVYLGGPIPFGLLETVKIGGKHDVFFFEISVDSKNASDATNGFNFC